MPGIAVVHLVRRTNDIALLKQFVRSYREHPAGVAHELIIVFKGFESDAQVQEHILQLGDIPHRRHFIPDLGFDLHAYFGTVQLFDFDCFCFLNSYSRILSADWLAKLHRWITQEGVGLVGASGSWQSLAGGYETHDSLGYPARGSRGLISRISRALKDRRPGMLKRRLWFLALRLVGILEPGRNFPPFPNHHLRTNAFMGRRSTLLDIRLNGVRSKLSAYFFESGNHSMTNQVLGLGLRVLVVGRDGKAYPPEHWPASNTFWQSRQENLLVADNQTDAYSAGDPTWNADLSFYAWGDQAKPA